MRNLFIILLSALSLTAVAQQKKVAVYVTGEQSGVSKVLGDQLVAAFAKSGKYTAVERTSSFLAELSKEQGYQRSGAVNDRDIARLGVQFGVNYVCVADMSDVFGEKYISARLINVETAEIENAHNVSGEINNMNSLLKLAGEIADNLSKGSFAEQAQYRDNLKARGLVDLGLPSGTLWKDKNEEGGFYTFEQAISKFGESIPSKEQWEELRQYCQWQWVGNGMKGTGPNGNFIIITNTNWAYCDGSFIRGGNGECAAYWSSTPNNNNHSAYYAGYASNEHDIIHIYSSLYIYKDDCVACCVRLIQ